MKQINDVIACVIDSGGSYLSLALRLAKEYKLVYYTCPSWVDAYPKMNKAYIGYGYDNIETIESPFEVFDEIDVWIFPDTYYGSFAQWLADQGELVWGSKLGEEMELQRDDLKKHMKKGKLPVNEFDVIKGMTNLRKYLEKNPDVYVKINKWRGTIETFYSKTYQLVKPELDEIEYKLGPLSEEIDFIVEKPVNGLEAGYDGWTIDGQYPITCLSGVEIKDKAYAGHIRPYEYITTYITDFNEVMADTFKKYAYRGFFSTETRIDNITPYMIDFTARCPCPPGDIYLEIFDNLGEIIYAGANGNVVIPKNTKQYGVELLMESEWACHNFQPVYFPDKFAQSVKLKKAAKINDINFVIPQSYGSSDIGAIVGLGDSLQEAIKNVIEVADSIEGNGIVIRQDVLEEAQESLDEFENIHK